VRHRGEDKLIHLLDVLCIDAGGYLFVLKEIKIREDFRKRELNYFIPFYF